ncbi:MULTISPECIES: 16S rRNA (adenine(1518)-N(6)/adenine(1519)-N(6))-dimethyltransferase RsmA [unclassified Facklamia]|uniref:16S rRNA (adenine(1518)-N(6)/adenine(1519)-N(6))- dimethyltransferase RsmA n=1 Tax=Aerococcaceae TaxID=186827 RepID=UPI0013BCB547|nr:MULTISPECIES: 16S rRNA (adenine(1518)-N(6)/adenine(1519)-N(6))-dimethyltransferase RsmA [unclassified Facklamia]NEW64895.1 16S rRNA (adenine(1518)-N(6)/adenine(1519)-N(6))-dimethyltransferase RsmA [Facklamia sp. 252]NEW68217.1 16S rRNA (adenine(1518)-N(6)/adenine(1519)-N(6))-dimethyltransferase RsmA [Facklamia sp. 253]QQD66060.1 16S rRNA (adenine(1518)-N(6)/adenine(1519)-N(6))-dimethyltransferase RsmA [Aerococcaceae bacterium zg-252]
MREFRPIATPTRTVEIMRQYDIKMKKSLGQNFLVEPQILEKMIMAGQIDSQTTVVEIGPGIGALTEYLARSAKEVVAFEIDSRFIEILKETLAEYDNVTVHHQDILKVNFEDDAYQSLRDAERLVVVANLPYYITTPIIMNLIESQLSFDALVMMMQKEVAERMTATVNTKSYNSLTLAIENSMKAEIAFIVPKGVFIPKPNVDSAVLKLVRREQNIVQVDNPQKLQKLIQIAFTQRRKTIWNNLRSHESELGCTAEKIEQALESAAIDKSRRAESLTLQDYAILYQALEMGSVVG